MAGEKRTSDICAIASSRSGSMLTYTTGVTSGAATAYPSEAPEFTTGFKWDSCYCFQ
jgi:ethanolamine utilization microcompartment shell protein EutL